jgi:AcrR family transcriptional regulator
VEKREPSGGESESELSRLPRGRHGLPREMVVENQRERLIAGIIEAVAEHGYNQTTIAAITKAATLSRRTFYEHFANKEDCFAAAYEATLTYVREATLSTAATEQEEWPERVRAGLGGLLTALASHPDLARLFLIAPASVGDEAVGRHHLAMRELVSTLIEGPPGPPGSLAPSETREQALAGGISRLVVGKVNAGEAESLGELLPALVELVLRPYLGGEEAVRIAGEV